MIQALRPRARRSVVSRLAVLILTYALTGAAIADEPAAVVEKLHDALQTLMKNAATLGYEGRVRTITPVLQETFDFPTIARIVTGQYWKGFTAEQRENFIATFARLSAATYADNFNEYAGETFQTLGTEEKKSSALVKTQIVDSDGKVVSLNYVLNEKEQRWRIVNVVADGVSDLALKRTEYGAVIAKEGLDALVAKLNTKIASYAAAGT